MSLGIMINCRGRKSGRWVAVGTDERPVGTMFDDAAITAMVKSEYVGEKNVKAHNIDVDTVAGTKKGFWPDWFHRGC